MKRGDKTMKNQEYTPGPWAVELSPISGPARIIAPNGCGQGCPCEVAEKVMPDDARLISAAPELAEALSLVEGMLDAFPGFDSRAVPFTDKATGNIGQVVRAALAKAGLL